MSGNVKSVPEYFGCHVFNEDVMRARLPKNVYKSLLKTKLLGVPLDEDAAEVIASVMKEWATEKGATHYSHWFQPMTGVTAEKHDSFIFPASDGRVVMEFSGKSLIKGEPDASSFPSGGLRATFEARGYTAWDPTSPAFIKDGSLYIPTVFCCYTGEVLDKKTPLLRSMDALSEQALRVLKLFGANTADRVTSIVGAEQEYFLIDKALYDRRLDLIFTGRTLFGAKAPKGQDLEDHYFGNIKERVRDYMRDLDEELWKLGIFAKTKHNESAPAQHELAPLYTTVNIASDQNQLIMEVMKKTALKHGLVCLLHEKPFAGVNGSGKHNNWSLITNDGQKLLNPGVSPGENIRFLTFLSAVIRAVDEFSDLFRLSAASAGNDLRLGADEAPPAVMSVYLGDELTSILDAMEKGEIIKSGGREFLTFTDEIPKFPKDTTDRNRTSPIAFTGNKFEFRTLGSADSIACMNMIINTAVAGVLKAFADRLENSQSFTNDLNKLLIETYKKHKRVIYNGNCYDAAWSEEAKKRGLNNYPDTAEAVPHYRNTKNIALFEELGVLSGKEINSRTEILLENYSKLINIEALTMLDMARRQIIPSAIEFSGLLAQTALAKKEIGVDFTAEKRLAKEAAEFTNEILDSVKALDRKLSEINFSADKENTAKACRDELLPVMESLRRSADGFEKICPEKLWAFPAYSDLLFRI
ncbi:MAG: glutamine synthetase III [Oscillospiraceae bacterium]|nr:glutamine synthetase III [Oscillospiraceae bacterium]